MRVVPVHSELIRLGLLDYHGATSAHGDKQLFPEIEPDARGFFSGTPSRFYRDYFRRVGIKQDKALNFHSLRHGFADALRRAGYRDEEFGFLLGHTKASTTGRYGIVAQGVLEQRAAMIEGVGFPGVDLKHLYATGL
jgi:integrase